MAKTRSLLIVPVLLHAAACQDGLEPACLPVVRPAIEVEVRDALTGEFRADSARGIAQDGAYADSLWIVRYHGPEIVPSALGGAYERPGTYSVRVERNGYRPWDTTRVRVQADRCGAFPVRLVARLSPIP
jgi:hypothetical protein